MRESAYQHLKLMKFKSTIKYVIKIQKAYGRVKMRRMIRRALMDKSWDKFFESQRLIAQKAELA